MSVFPIFIAQHHNINVEINKQTIILSLILLRGPQ